MAYMNQDQKKMKETALKPILKKYGVTGRLAVRHNTLVLNITKGKIDFMNDFFQNVPWGYPEYLDDNYKPDHLQVNPYHFRTQFHGEALQFLNAVFDVMNEGNYNNSDVQSDYFDTGFYVDINIGKWNKPYQLTA